MAFLCVCPEKSLEFGADEKLHRCAKEQFIRGVLESVNYGADKKTILTLPGGGIAVQHTEGAAPKIAVDGDTSTLAALTGTVQNYSYLVKKYLQQELHLPPNVTLEAIRERMPVSEAELLCKMYSQMGTGMISKLRGHFSFCIYDATTVRLLSHVLCSEAVCGQVRVLAGTDCSGAVPLYQGKLSDNSLFIASSEMYPGDAHSIETIPAGHYKYGWHAGAMKFANPESEVRHSAEEANSAANAALAGLFCKATDKVPVGRRSSFDSAHSALSRKPRSRRGSLDTSVAARRSMDSAVESVKGKNRADGQNWWRSDDNIPGNKIPQGIKTSKKNSRRYKKKHAIPSGPSKTQTPAEEFIDKLGGAYRGDAASMTMLMKLLDDSPCSLVVTSAEDENLVFVNKSFEEQTGYRSEEVLGQNCRFLQAPPGGSIIQSHGSKMLRRAIQEGRSCSVRLINYKKNGNPVLNDCSIVPLRDSEGKITHHVGMHTFQPLEDESESETPGQMATAVLLRSRFQLPSGHSPCLICICRSCGDVASVVSVPSTPMAATNSIAF